MADALTMLGLTASDTVNALETSQVSWRKRELRTSWRRSRLRCLGASIGSAGIAGGTGGNVESSKRPPAKRFGAGAHAVAAAAAAAGMCRRDAGAAT